MTSTAPGPQIEGLIFLERLGSGGYSDVYLYERRSPRMKVAVKVLKDGRLSESERAQFAAEAETMAELADHPYIVQVFTTGTLEDGRPYLVMKYYPPPNLAVRAGRERLSVPEVLRTGIKIASAVETAHRAGILHRDIKPANILVSQYGEPGLTDFGIAGQAADTDESDDLGVSIPWSPPEVLTGVSNGSVRSDVYSLAASVWHLLVGRSPFEIPAGDNAPRALMTRVLRTAPPATGRPEVPASLNRLLQQAMAKNPDVRPRSVMEFARALQAVEQEQRFGRTELVVNDENVHRRDADASTSTHASEDSTRLRAVRPQQPGRTARSAPASGAEPAASRFQAPPTVARPVKPQRDPGKSSRGVAGSIAEDPATVRRPVQPSVPTLSEDETGVPDAADKRGLKAKWVFSAAGGLIVVVAVIGAVVASGGSPSTQASTPPVTNRQNLDPVPPGRPVVVAVRGHNPKAVTFTWTYNSPRAGDTFSVVDYPPGGQPSGSPHATKTPRISLASTKKGLCVDVTVVRSVSGQQSVAGTVCS